MKEHKYKLNMGMVQWLEENIADYKELALNDHYFPIDRGAMITMIAKSPHSMRERRDLILKFCDHFNMPRGSGVREAQRMIKEWQDLNINREQ